MITDDRFFSRLQVRLGRRVVGARVQTFMLSRVPVMPPYKVNRPKFWNEAL